MNIQEEIKEFTKLIKKYPDISDLYIGRAILYIKNKQYEKAVKDYETADEDYIYDIVAVCLRHNLRREIERLYTQKINKDKNNILNYMSRARFYMTEGKNEKALADCERILKISPENKLILEFKKVLTEKLKAKQNHTKGRKTPPVFL